MFAIVSKNIMLDEIQRTVDHRSAMSAISGEQPTAKHIYFLILIGMFVLSPVLIPNVVTINAEKRVWEVTQHMLQTKNFMVPNIEGSPHLTKPPLLYWLGAITGLALQRDDVVIVRLPCAISAIVCIVLTYLMGCSLKSRELGFLSALILISSNSFTGRSLLGTFDIALTAAVLMAIYGSWQWINARKKSGIILLFVGSFLGFMIKGPVAWLIVGIVFLGELSIRKELKRLLHWETLIFSIILFACSSLWFIYLVIHEPLARTVFVNELLLPLGMVSQHPTAEHFEPIYQYLLLLPGNIIPWTAYLPMLVLFFMRRRPLFRGSSLWFPLIWFGGNLLCFSIFPSKQKAYLLPLYPAIALLVGWCLVEMFELPETEISYLRYTNMVLGFLCFPAALAFAIVFWVRVGAPLSLSIVVGSIFTVMGVALIWSTRRRKHKSALIYFLSGWLLVIPLLYGYFLPRHNYINEYKKSPAAMRYLERRERLLNFLKYRGI
jgi:4-amino-4-deoxy-L-arabinose transferase-like glycosyltransferase